MPGRGHRTRQRRQGRRHRVEHQEPDPYAIAWPNITRKGEAPADADEWKDKPDKAQFFSPEPGKP